jgi:YhcH/YjgK/YiaL family protein
MILDTIENKDLYTALSPRIKASFKYLAETDFSLLAPGRYDIDGSNIYALVQEYQTIPKEQGKWECHKDYIDIQYVLSGTEQIGYGNIEGMKIQTEYNPEKDIAFLSGNGDYLTIGKDTYCIFFPNDAHQPKIAVNNNPEKVRKVVIKIKIN